MAKIYWLSQHENISGHHLEGMTGSQQNLCLVNCSHHYVEKAKDQTPLLQNIIKITKKQ